MAVRDICMNCHKPIRGTPDGTGGLTWKHMPTGTINYCQHPKRAPIIHIPCTCEPYPHFWCYSFDCKCERHSQDGLHR